MALENPGFLEQPNRAVDGRNRDIGIDRSRPRVERLDVGMILAFAQDASDDLALFGDPEALVGAQLLNVDRTMHGA